MVKGRLLGLNESVPVKRRAFRFDGLCFFVRCALLMDPNRTVDVIQIFVLFLRVKDMIFWKLKGSQRAGNNTVVRKQNSKPSQAREDNTVSGL